MKKKISLKYKKERAILSDVLPYEIPLIYSNRHFYDFLTKYKIEIDSDNNIDFQQNGNPTLEKIIELIFGKQKSKKDYFISIPFLFKIPHKTNEYRELSLISPLNQVYLVKFYDSFQETIKYYSSISPYSIRRPYKVAKSKIKKDYIYEKLKAHNTRYEKIELHNKEYKNLKTFFIYKGYDNIGKFFESRQYQKRKKKYNSMCSIDISRCFDSIYTHSIVWALHNKEIVKNNIPSSKKTFAGLFDKFMQNINYGETNGILIGSEFARIFAEILLQQIDKIVAKELEIEKIWFKKHYEIFRYVDDFYIFYNDEKDKNKIIDLYRHNLKEHKLHVNEHKQVSYTKPIITQLTIAKIRISDLLNWQLTIHKKSIPKKIKSEKKSTEELSDFIDYLFTDSISKETSTKIQWLKFRPQKLITRFKIIIKETNIEYKDVVNYTLEIIERKNNLLINAFNDAEQNQKDELKNNFIQTIRDILEVAFFIYAVSPRVSATIKIASFLDKIIQYVNRPSTIIKHDDKDLIFKAIYDEIYPILKKNKIEKYSQIETLYLLIILGELGKKYRIGEDFLDELFFGDNKKKDDKQIRLNYFAITTLLFYIKNINKYSEIKEKIKKQIEYKLSKSKKDNLYKNTELIMLLLDSLTCPYLEEEFKIELLGTLDIENKSEIIEFSDCWFIKWKNFNLANEIESKKSQEVYS